MSEWLAMPARLQADSVRVLVEAWQQLNYPGSTPASETSETRVISFANAYSVYYNRLGYTKKSTNIDSKIAEARAGSLYAAQTLWQWFIDAAVEKEEDSVTLKATSEALEQARSMKGKERYTRCRTLFHELEELIGHYRDGILYPLQKPNREKTREVISIAITKQPGNNTEQDTIQVSQSVSSEPLSVSEDQAQELWNALAINVKGSAERIWRDMFLDSHVPVQRSTLSNIARISHRLMLLWLEVILYQDRAYSNFEARITEDGGATHAASESTRRGIHKHIKSYHETIRQWDKELTAAMKKIPGGKKKKTYFLSHHLESQQLHRLIGQFSDPSPEELGWDSQITEARDELRYQLRDEVRLEMLADGRWVASLGRLILKFTTGYGTRPFNFVRTAAILLLLYATLFFLNDLLYPLLAPTGSVCATSQLHIHQWTDVPLIALHYLYIAVTTMTTLGSDSALAAYCSGWSTQVLLIFSTATGYFMLGLLGALLYTQLTQRD